MVALGMNMHASMLDAHKGEMVQTLAAGTNVRIERIVSRGHASPEGFWYDQPDAEWVMVVSGRARLQIADQADEIAMGPGDTLLLPAHCRHRITWTEPDQPTVWLAVFVTGELMAG